MFDHIKQKIGKFGIQKQAIRISVIGLTPEEITLLASMLTIISIRKDENWQVTDTHEAEVFLVNIDSLEGEMFLCRYDQTLPIIRYSQEKDPTHPSQLNKPLRARELLQALTPFRQQTSTTIAHNTNRWNNLQKTLKSN